MRKAISREMAKVKETALDLNVVIPDFSGCTTTSGTTCTLSNVTSTGSVTASFVASTVNGRCGTAAGVASAIVPNAGLCATGTPSLVAASAGGYSWSCAGTDSGSTAQCTAPGASAPSPLSCWPVLATLSR